MAAPKENRTLAPRFEGGEKGDSKTMDSKTETAATGGGGASKVDDEKSSSSPPKSPVNRPPQSETATATASSSIPVLEFSEADYITIQCDVDSPFDRLLRKRWQEAQTVMNYTIGDPAAARPSRPQSKLLSPNRYRFVATLLPGRGPGQRRTPQTMSALRMPIDPDQFNFTKVSPDELLFKVKSTNAIDFLLQLDGTILVNRSPIEYCSALLVPSLDRCCLPQVMTEPALHLAVALVALSDYQSLRLGYNSPGSMASVNHLHWHLYYFEHKLVIEDLPVIDYVLQDWPIPAIVFEITELNDDYIGVIIKDAMRVIDFCLTSGDICHNLFLSRTSTGSIRIFIWLLEPRFGLKDNANINVAFCELSGYFICKSEQSFREMDEDKCLEALRSVESYHQKVLHLLS